MSRYFKYKTGAQLVEDAGRRGLTIALQADLSPLLSPLVLDGRTVGNRLAIHPMEGCDGELDGKPGPLTLRRYERFGGGGAKLIWGEACAVVPEGRANPRQLLINDANAASLEAVLRACREAHRRECGDDGDLVVGLQLTHSGRYSFAGPILAQHDPLLDPWTVVDKNAGVKAGPDFPLISDDDLLRLQDAFVAAADLAYRIGFDFVDVKQCHRYLLNELLAARTRPGRFGGSFENRTRFVREVAARIREGNPGKIVATRMNAFDGVPYQPGPDGVGVPCPFATPVPSCWGTLPDDPFEPDLSEPIALVGALQKLGVAMVNVTIGNPYANAHLGRPYENPPPDGYETPEHPLIGVDRHFRLTGQIQAAFPDLAVVGTGYSWLQAFAFEAGAANLAAGRATVMGVGRGSLSQPDFGLRIARGEPLDSKRICRTFSYCTALMRAKHNEMGQFATGCPPFDKQVYGPIWDEARKPPARSQDLDRQ